MKLLLETWKYRCFGVRALSRYGIQTLQMDDGKHVETETFIYPRNGSYCYCELKQF